MNDPEKTQSLLPQETNQQPLQQDPSAFQGLFPVRDEEHLEGVTGGMDPIRAFALNHVITNFTLDERYPITRIPESPQREAADAQQWVSENPNKRRRIS